MVTLLTAMGQTLGMTSAQADTMVTPQSERNSARWHLTVLLLVRFAIVFAAGHLNRRSKLAVSWEPVPALVAQVCGHLLGPQERLQAPRAQLPAEARVLDATPRRLAESRLAAVYPYDTRFESRRDTSTPLRNRDIKRFWGGHKRLPVRLDVLSVQQMPRELSTFPGF